MVKGINKRIIEIRNTDNLYFEKAILFVKNEKSNCNHDVLKDQANIFLEQFSKPSIILNIRKKIITTAVITFIISSTAIIAIFCALFL